MPAVVTAAGFISVAFPAALLPLLVTRSRLFPSLMARGVICQAVLVVAGWMAVDAFARLAAQALAAMTSSGDAEVLQVAGELVRATDILTRTIIALVAPLVCMLAWLAFLRPSGAAAAHFTAGITHSLQERDAGTRGRCHTVVGGVLLLLLGALTRFRT